MRVNCTLAQDVYGRGEVARRERELIAGPLDVRSDIFSFGAVLYRCLAGRPAFEGEALAEVVEAGSRGFW
jgi:hypothetical protein